MAIGTEGLWDYNFRRDMRVYKKLQTAKKIKDVGAYAQPVAIYKLSIPLQFQSNKSEFILGGINYVNQYDDIPLVFHTFFICDEEGNLLDYQPAINHECKTIEECFGSIGYTLLDE